MGVAVTSTRLRLSRRHALMAIGLAWPIALVAGAATADEIRARTREAASSTPEGAPAPPSSSEAPPPPVAEQLWSELYCMCGDCEHMSLADCSCDNAKKERSGILARVLALSKEGKAPDQVHATVLAEYLKRFGEGARVGHWQAKEQPIAWRNLAVPLVAACIGIVVLIAVAERVRSWLAGRGQGLADVRRTKKRWRRGRR